MIFIKKLTKQPVMIKAMTLLIGICLMAMAVIYANAHLPPGLRQMTRMGFETATVLQIIDEHTIIDEAFENVRIGSIIVQLELTSGEFAGAVGETIRHVGPLNQLDLEVGEINESQFNVLIHGRDRTYILLGSVVIFFLVLALIGGKKGISAIVGLIFTLATIMFVLIPLLIQGYNAISLTVIIVSVTAVVSLILIGGFTKKTVVAIIGCISGVIVAAVLATIVGNLAGITGFNMDEAEILLPIALDSQLRISGLFISGILIASLGAVMDIAMTIASSAEEVVSASNEISSKQLFKANMNVGRDAMGTMSTTLILAFVGTSLNMLIIIFAYGVTFNQFINTDFIAIEIIRSLAGSLGIAMTVPIVAFAASKIMVGGKKV